MNTPTNPPAQTLNNGSVPAQRPRIESGALLKGASSVEIEHAGQCYLLRVTRENKLILTK
jgi:hemin uptake protein HemP